MKRCAAMSAALPGCFWARASRIAAVVASSLSLRVPIAGYFGFSIRKKYAVATGGISGAAVWLQSSAFHPIFVCICCNNCVARVPGWWLANSWSLACGEVVGNIVSRKTESCGCSKVCELSLLGGQNGSVELAALLRGLEGG